MPEGGEQLDDIRGVLLDLDGTVFVGDRLVPGAAEAIAALRRGGLPLCFGTNTTRISRTSLLERMHLLGVEFAAAEPLIGQIISSLRHHLSPLLVRCMPGAVGELSAHVRRY